MFAEHEGTLSQVHLTGFDVGYEEERDAEYKNLRPGWFMYLNFNISIENIENYDKTIDISMIVISTILTTTIVQVY